MRPNCDLKLQLFPVNDSDSDNIYYHHQNHPSFAEESSRSPTHEEQQETLATIFSHHHHFKHRSFEVDSSIRHRHEQQPLTTIFFDERLCLPDLQARDLPLVASPKTDEAMKYSNTLETQLRGTSNLAMQKSLKSFLQKRKLRNQSTSPYTIKDLVKGSSMTRTGKLPIED